MKLNLRVIILILNIIALPLILAGCWDSKELNEIPIVVGIGLDAADAPDVISLTSQIAKTEQLKKASTSKSSGGDKPYVNINSRGRTVADAVQDFTHYVGNKIYLSHNNVFIFGKEAASEGLQKYIDFFLRDEETRPTTSMLISDTTASEILEVESKLEQFPAIYIMKLTSSLKYTSQGKRVEFQELITALKSKTSCAILPLISTKNIDGQKMVYIKGMAVFKEDKMVGELNETQSRGLLWVIGKIKTGVIDVPCPGGVASIEIKNVKTEVTPEIKDKKICMKIKIKEKGSLIGQTSYENLSTLENFKKIEDSQKIEIENEIKAVLYKARELNTDIFGFGEKISKKYRKQWDEIEKDWDKTFPNIEVEIEIEDKIISTGLITKPASLKE